MFWFMFVLVASLGMTVARDKCEPMISNTSVRTLKILILNLSFDPMNHPGVLK